MTVYRDKEVGEHYATLVIVNLERKMRTRACFLKQKKVNKEMN